MSHDKSLKKALHRTIFKAMGDKGRQATASKIVNDLEDENSLAQVPVSDIPATKTPILQKDVSVSEMHQQKQMNAQATLGKPLKAKGPKMPTIGKMPKLASAPAGGGNGPKIPKLPGVKINKAMGGAMLQSEAPQKGVEMLKNFIQKAGKKKIAK